MSQLENGVGLVALLRSQFDEALDRCEKELTADTTDTVLVTGVAAAPFIEQLVNKAKQRFGKIRARVLAVENEFFGETITVAGLVTGGDILRRLSAIHCERILIPEVMLRREGDRFLDDVLPEEIEKATGARIQIVPVDGTDLLYALLDVD